MKQYDFTKEEMNFIIGGLKEVCSNPDIIKKNFLTTENTTEYSTCAEFMKFRLKTFLDIIKDVFVKNVPLVQEQKEKETHKYRLFSTYGESLDWIEITDEQLRLMEYLQSNDLLDDDVDFEECEALKFKKI